jgi:hypothetical protein
MAKKNATQFMTEILAMWTETNADARRAVIQSHFDEDVHFQDRDGQFVGHAGLEAFSDSLQSRFPTACFALAESPQTLGNAIRAYWLLWAAREPAGSQRYGLHHLGWRKSERPLRLR